MSKLEQQGFRAFHNVSSDAFSTTMTEPLEARNPGFSFHRRSAGEQREALDAEFLALRQADEQLAQAGSFHTARCEHNRDKNRYSDVLPFDGNVYPPATSGCGGGPARSGEAGGAAASTPAPLPYINASLVSRLLPAAVEPVRGCAVAESPPPRQMPRAVASGRLGLPPPALGSPNTCPHEFVAAQAPLPHIIDDWWAAIASSGSRLVVMLTQEREGGMVKAHRYWPSRVNDPVALPSGTLVLTSETLAMPQVVVRDLVYTPGAPSAASPPVQVRQVHYCAWPDFGVPSSTEAFLYCLRCIQQSPPEWPVFVHCSAGIGRTGTLIAVYQALCLAQNGQLHDGSLFDVVLGLKQARSGMVQRREQYAFIYQCVVDLLRGAASTATRTH